MWRRIGYVVQLTLSNGISAGEGETPNRFTHVDDVTHDYANPRAICTADSSLKCYIGLPQCRIPLCHNTATTCFFGAICGCAPITSLILHFTMTVIFFE